MRTSFLVLLVLLTVSTALAEEDVHRTLDERLFLLSNGTSYERIEVLEYFAAFKDKDVFVSRRLQDKIVNVLKDKELDPRVRSAAAEAVRKLLLSRVIDKYAIADSIMAVVKDDSDDVIPRAGCVKAMGVLIKLFPSEARNELYLKDLRDLLKLPASRNALKVEAIRTLCMLGDSSAESVLHFALADPDLVDTAVESLYDLLIGGGSIKSINIALKLLDVFVNKDVSTETRVKAGECLIYIVRSGTSGNFTLDKVTALLSNPSTEAKLVVTACKVLYTINNSRSLKPIVDKLGEESLDDDTLVYMIQILGDFLRQVTPSDELKKVVNNALYTFGRFLNYKDPQDPQKYKYSPKVRKVTAFAMGQVQAGFNVKGAVLLLIEALEDPEETVSSMAYESLKVLTRQDFGRSRDAWKKWFDKAGLK
ncbi:MAG: hypothetical protein Kow00107_02120 [Planctomycetota bacterium]